MQALREVYTLKKILAVFICVLLLVGIGGCVDSAEQPNAAQPVTLTVWHTYVEQMGDKFGDLVEEFNTTVGAREGIVVDIGSVSNASEHNERLLDAADDVPGTPKLPDMAVVYPQIALQLAQEGLLLDLNTCFSAEELAEFAPQFLKEGYLEGDALYLLPIAKSTEVLYVNRTFFDPFALETGITLEDLSSVEGLMDASKRYYEWTDAQTPDIPQDGRAFYYPDNPFNFAEIGFAQMGQSFFVGETLALDSPTFACIWESYYPLAVRGGVAIFDNYGNYLAKTGGVVCVTSTSAGAIYYPDTVTYADNTKEDVEFDVLPYPIFSDGEKIAMQRGGSICILKSEPKKEYAAALFLKWLTEPAQNLRFTTNAGYLPVKESAFKDIANSSDMAENLQVRKMLQTAVEMQNEYSFFIPTVSNVYNGLSVSYSERIYAIAKQDRVKYLELIESGYSEDEAYSQVSEDAFERFCADFKNSY